MDSIGACDVSLTNFIQITLMDWGNAFVRSKVISATGHITSIEMELNLDGDFRKTKKKITWLAQPTAEHPLVPVSLYDYDYLITKKKLEEGDDVADFVTPVTEFKEEAVADANVLDLQKGDVMQFERKGYFILDAILDENGSKRLEFIRIPDGRATSLASKAGTTDALQINAPTPIGAAAPSKSTEALAETSMYSVPSYYGGGKLETPADTQMYKVKPVYDN